MQKYLIQASYTSEGAKGVAKDGGSGRKAAAEQLLKSVDGKLDAFYFALGEEDAYLIVDMPDNVAAAAISLAVASSGFVRIRTTVLLTPEEMDKASKRTVTYRAPGK